MREFTLSYSTKDGEEQVTQSLEAGPTSGSAFSLTRLGITAIDLSPLKNSELEEINLYYNELTEIDLTPLASCENFENLHLLNNKLQSIDLAPFEGHKTLSRIKLSDNCLDQIDLTPLATCENLEHIDVMSNVLISINLSPLRSCKRLEDIWISNNKFNVVDLQPLEGSQSLKKLFMGSASGHGEHVDITPLLTCPNLEKFWFSEDAVFFVDPIYFSEFKLPENLFLSYPELLSKERLRLFDHSKILEDVVERTSWKEAASILLEHQPIMHYPILGFQGYEGYEDSLYDLACSVPEGVGFEEGRKYILKQIVHGLHSRLDQGGSTFNLDVEVMTTRESIKLVPKILELRDEEMKEIRVSKFWGGIDITEIRKTYYGSKVLDALNIEELAVDDETFNEIKKAINELGYDLDLELSDES